MNLQSFNQNLQVATLHLFRDELGFKVQALGASSLPLEQVGLNDSSGIGSLYPIGFIPELNYGETTDETLENAQRYDGIFIFAVATTKNLSRSEMANTARKLSRSSNSMPIIALFSYDEHISIASVERTAYKVAHIDGEKAGKMTVLRGIKTVNTHAGHQKILQALKPRTPPSTFEELYEVGANYEGEISFYLDCGSIQSIVHGLWDELGNFNFGEVSNRQPFSIVEIKEIIQEDGIEVYSVMNNGFYSENYVIGCDWLYSDTFASSILNYYEVGNRKLEFKSIGSFLFCLIDLYFDEYPEYLVFIDGKKHIFRLIESLDVGIYKVVPLLKQGIFLDEYEDPISASFEEFTLIFYDARKIGITDWKGDTKDYEKNILVQYAVPEEAIVATLTSLDELEAFVEWDRANVKRYEALLNAAKKAEHKFDWDLMGNK